MSESQVDNSFHKSEDNSHIRFSGQGKNQEQNCQRKSEVLYDGCSEVKELPQPMKEMKKYHFIDLFKYQSLRMSTIGYIIMYTGMQIQYWGVQYGLRLITNQEQIYILGVSISLGEFLGCLISTLLISSLQRKTSTVVTQSISIIGCLSFAIFGVYTYQNNCEFCWEQLFAIIFVGIIRMSNIISFAIKTLWSNEFYPTPLRAMGQGLQSALGEIGATVAPFILLLSQTFNINLLMLVGLFSFPSILGTFLPKETLGLPLKNVVEEDEYDQVKQDYYEDV